MHWYYSKNGTQLGPVEQPELIAKMVSGEVAPGDLVWKEGMVDWLPSGQIGELRALMPPSPGYGGSPTPYTPPMAPYGGGEEIPSYLWQSIVVTILCCIPLGIPAIVFAARVEGLRNSGDIAGAKAASATARTWCWVSFGVALGGIVLYAVFIGMVAAAGNF